MDALSWLAEPFQHRFLWRALVACACAGIAAAPIGCVLVVRRLSFAADALAHGLLPGIGIAFLCCGASVPALLVGGAGAGLLAAAASALVSRWTRVKEDAAVAAANAALFALGVLLVSRIGGSVDLLRLLFGDVLGVGRAGLALCVGSCVATVAAFAIAYRPIALECFDPGFHRACGGRGTLTHLGLLALAVLDLVAALHAVGAVLALGLFILPAATAGLWCERWSRMIVVAALIALLGSVIGLVASYHLALAAGPCVIATLGALFALSVIAAPRQGLIARWRHPATHEREDEAAACELP